MKNLIRLTVLCAAGIGGNSAFAGTLDDVRAAGALRCGVAPGVPGFSAADADGNWMGIDVEVCRAVSATVFGDPDRVEYVPLSAQNRFSALTSGEVDMLSRVTTWTMSRDADLRTEFAGINYYDGQGFLVATDLGVTSATELNGATVCIQTGTTTELNLADYFRNNGMEFEPVPVADQPEALAQYIAGACDVYTTDSSALAALRSTLPDPSSAMVLPEIISKEPLGPLVRHGDSEWEDVVRWSLNAMIAAEEMGVTSKNVAELAANPGTNPEINRLLGTEGNLGEMIGADKSWAVAIISTVGNYGEAFERHVGPNTPIGLERGLNAQWTDGGLMYSPPFR